MRRHLQLAAVCFALLPSAEAVAGATAIPVPAVTILQGDVLAEEMVVEQSVTASARVLKNYYTSRESVLGKVARRVLPAGHAIPLNALREQYVFKEGTRVGLMFTTGGLSIETSGIALEPGVAGKMVSVRNADTGVVVRGFVRESGYVQVGEK